MHRRRTLPDYVRALATVLCNCLLCLFVLAGLSCTSRAPVPPAPPGPGAPTTPTQRPYTVLGQSYQPIASAHGFVEEGIASWYGHKFHGRPTACGERYDMHKLTAAHRILPMHTHVRVTNLENGRQLVVRINDRGPFVKNRIIDLSYAGATELGMAEKGTARVRVEAIETLPRDLPGRYYVQIGSFAQQGNALALSKRMQQLGYSKTRVQRILVGDTIFWRVQVGTFPRLSLAEQALTRLSSENPASFILAD